MKVQLDGGQLIDLGKTEATPTISIADFSRRVTDDFGVTTVVERGFARRLSVRLAVPTAGVDALQQRLAALRATPARWIAGDRIAWLSAFGFYKDFEVDLATPAVSFCRLTVEGLAETEVAADAGGDPAPEGHASTLQLLQPIAITGGVLAASTAPETDHPEWSAGVSYGLGARVIKAATHRVYESAAAANLGADPAAANGKWIDVGPTNRWAAFDQALGTATSAPGSITVTLDPATLVDAVALLDVVGATVRVQAPGYDRTLPAGPGAVTFLDLPATDAAVTVTIVGPGEVSVGTLMLGRLVRLGITEAAPTAGITDYSRKEIDAFGDIAVVERAWAKRMTARALIRTDAVDLVAGRIAAVRARPSLWIGRAGQDSLTVYGFFKDFSIEVGATVSKVSLSIEGLSKAAPVPAPVPVPDPDISWEDISDPNGTKPADNADVTGDNTSKDTNAVAGRPAGQLVGDVDLNALSVLAYTFNGQLLKDYVNARLFVDGKPVNTAIVEETAERIDGQNALAEKLALIGAANQDGSAFILNTGKVRVGAAPLGERLDGLDQSIAGLGVSQGALAQSLSEVTTSMEGQTASIQTLLQTVVEPGEGAAALAIFRMNVNGHVVGYKATDDGRVGKLTFTFDSTRFQTPQGEDLFVVDGTVPDGVYAPKMRVGRLTYDSLVEQFVGGNRQLLNLDSWYFEIPGGWIVQGGRYRATISREVALSILFAKPFPNQCLIALPVAHLNSFSAFRDLWLQTVGNPTQNGFSVQTQAATSDNMTLDGFNWIAVGS